MRIESIGEEAAAAASRIREHVRRTPLERSEYFSELTGANVWLKLENLQVTGSFKIRGACNRLLTLPREQVDAGDARPRRAPCAARSARPRVRCPVRPFSAIPILRGVIAREHRLGAGRAQGIQRLPP